MNDTKKIVVDFSRKTPRKKKVPDAPVEMQHIEEIDPRLLVSMGHPASVLLAPQKRQRVVTDTTSWTKCIVDQGVDIYYHEIQKKCVQEAMSVMHERHPHSLVESQILKKIQGYRSQDLQKQLYDERKFVDFPFVISLLQDCDMKCFYCKEYVMVLYEFVREPRQWTLERIDNSQGHNCDNVQIACLTCNLHRRTMFHERYLMTKQMAHVVKSP